MLFTTTMVAAQQLKVAVIGGGITGATIASQLAGAEKRIDVDVFDQGRSGVGGRTSHRIPTDDVTNMRWDHGCQFFRADTERFRRIVDDWIVEGFAAEWKPQVVIGAAGAPDFFGFPRRPPFFVGVGGMHTLARRLLQTSTEATSGNTITLYEQHRVAAMEHNTTDSTWTLLGTTGAPAFHDTPESNQTTTAHQTFGTGYDYVVLTDVSSSSFGPWHRAAAGVPDAFAQRVRTTVGARVPLFTCLLAFDPPLPVATSAATLQDDDLWFVARTNDKPGHTENDNLLDCWTLVSTPAFALRMLRETPMQNEATGAFVPQSRDYLTTVPGPLLEAAFGRIVGRWLGDGNSTSIPEPVYMTAQRWGSALPGRRRHSGGNDDGIEELADVLYDAAHTELSPTTQQIHDRPAFIADPALRLVQAGDMVSTYTPGMEGAVLSGLDAAAYIVEQMEAPSASSS